MDTEFLSMQGSAEYSSTRAKFIKDMSHDIRVPMNAVIGYADMAKKYISDPEKAEKCLDNVKIAAQQLLKLVNDITDVFMAESGEIVINEEPIDIIKISEQLAELYSEDVKNKNLRFIFKQENVNNRIVLADRLYLNQILSNILSNAVKYTSSGTIKYILKQNDSEKDGIASYDFIVRDTGIGMSKQMLEKVFDFFARDDSALISEVEGNGLGIPIAKSLVEAMGGTISINSTENAGTEVIVHIDFKVAAEEDASNKETEYLYNEKSTRKKILLAEDNSMNREIAKDMLEDMGFTVDAVTDGFYAFEKIKASDKDNYDMIIMDIQMPVMDGYQATRQIRALNREWTKKIPIIAMTANAFDEDRKAAFDSGMNEHIAKPINRKKLESTLSKFM